MNASKIMLGFVVTSFVLASSLVACQNEDDSTSGDANLTSADERLLTADELLAQAVSLAQSRERLGCDGDADILGISRTVRDALATDESPAFRAKVTSDPTLQKALAHTLDWQTFLGAYDADKPETLVSSLSADVTLWGVPYSAGVPSQRLELHADGKASLFTLEAPADGSDVDPKAATYTELSTTWSLDADGETFHVGDQVFALQQHTEITLAAIGIARPTFYSIWRECGA